MKDGYNRDDFTAAMFAEAEAATEAAADTPVDWIGPLEAMHTDTRGRGVRAVRSIQAGEVLMVQRPLSAKHHDVRQSKNLVTDINSVRQAPQVTTLCGSFVYQYLACNVMVG